RADGYPMPDIRSWTYSFDVVSCGAPRFADFGGPPRSSISLGQRTRWGPCRARSPDRAAVALLDARNPLGAKALSRSCSCNPLAFCSAFTFMLSFGVTNVMHLLREGIKVPGVPGLDAMGENEQDDASRHYRLLRDAEAATNSPATARADPES